MSARTIDIFGMIRAGERLAGEEALAALPRLASLLAGVDGTLCWTARGECRRDPLGGEEMLLVLAAAATPALACGKCLGPVTVDLRVARTLRVVADEATAAALDELESEIDVIAGSRQFDLIALLEDEAILALPLLAAHEHCAAPAVAGDREEERTRPLAGLAAFRRGGSNGTR